MLRRCCIVRPLETWSLVLARCLQVVTHGSILVVMPSEPPPPTSTDTPNQQGILQMLFQHVTEELRSRRQPEYIYTAAAVGAFGAIAWGVATLATLQIGVPNWRHPALTGIIAIVMIAIPVIIKIRREHSHYIVLRKEQVDLIGTMAQECKLDEEMIPTGLKKSSIIVGRGHLLSIFIVTGAGLGATLFCASIWLLRTQ